MKFRLLTLVSCRLSIRRRRSSRDSFVTQQKIIKPDMGKVAQKLHAYHCQIINGINKGMTYEIKEPIKSN